jgi:uncharacterized LabA/DUF88 family protein
MVAMDDKKENNYAYIDGQNLHAGTEASGWKLNHKKFREYLKKELGVTKAYIFIGFMEEYQTLYTALQEAGFILHFKPLVRYEDATIKGNVDADLVLQAMVDYSSYDKAVIVSGDGDFIGLMRHLANSNKLKSVMIPNKEKYSSLFKRLEEYSKYVIYLDDLRRELEYRTIRKQKPRNGNRQNKNGDESKQRRNDKSTSQPTDSYRSAKPEDKKDSSGTKPKRFFKR